MPEGAAPAVLDAAKDLEAIAPDLLVELSVDHVLADTEQEDLPSVGDGFVTNLLG